MNQSIEEDDILRDVEKISRILQAVDLADWTVCKLLVIKIRQQNIFGSALGEAFVNYLSAEGMYEISKTADTVIADFKELSYILGVMQTKPSGRSASLLKKYRFRNVWIQEFFTQYLQKFRTQIAEYESPHRLVGKNTLTVGRKRKRLQKGLGMVSAACFAAALLCFSWGLHLREQAALDDYKAELLADVKQETGSVETAVTESGTERESIQTSIVSTETESEGSPEILKKYRKLQKKNSDMVGWLEIAGTSIDYPVMQKPEDEDYYLSHDFLGEESKSGLLFVDGKAALNPPDDNVVVYGHNMKSGEMFGELLFYKDSSYFQYHPRFQLDTLYEKRFYQIVAVLIVDTSETDGFCYYECRDLSDKAVFEQLTDFLAENQLYDTQNEVEYGDEIVMLSTCESTSKSSRFVVVGKRVSDD